MSRVNIKKYSVPSILPKLAQITALLRTHGITILVALLFCFSSILHYRQHKKLIVDHYKTYVDQVIANVKDDLNLASKLIRFNSNPINYDDPLEVFEIIRDYKIVASKGLKNRYYGKKLLKKKHILEIRGSKRSLLININSLKNEVNKRLPGDFNFYMQFGDAAKQTPKHSFISKAALDMGGDFALNYGIIYAPDAFSIIWETIFTDFLLASIFLALIHYWRFLSVMDGEKNLQNKKHAPRVDNLEKKTSKDLSLTTQEPQCMAEFTRMMLESYSTMFVQGEDSIFKNPSRKLSPYSVILPNNTGEKIDVGALISFLQRLFEHELCAKDINMLSSTNLNLIYLQYSKATIMQIISSIVYNFCRLSRDGSVISLKLSKQQDKKIAIMIESDSIMLDEEEMVRFSVDSKQKISSLFLLRLGEIFNMLKELGIKYKVAPSAKAGSKPISNIVSIYLSEQVEKKNKPEQVNKIVDFSEYQ